MPHGKNIFPLNHFNLSIVSQRLVKDFHMRKNDLKPCSINALPGNVVILYHLKIQENQTI